MDSLKPKKTLVEETYDALVDAICTGEFLPGTRLNQDDIATRLNVSRQPVNSAISILKANGLVEDTGRRSVVVTRFDRNLFRAIYEYRTVIEPFAVQLAGSNLPRDAEKTAQKVLHMGDRALATGKLGALIHADMTFHDMIYGWSGNQVIQTSMRTNWHHIRRSMAEVLRNPDNVAEVWQQHRQIVDHLLEAKCPEATQVMRDHITASYEVLAAAIPKDKSG